MARAKNYFAWLGRLVAREIGQRVVEIGCGLGNFTPMLLEREVVIALDIKPECIERLKERYPNKNNLHLFVCDVNSPAFSGLIRFQADSCVCLNVLEHIADDQRALKSMAGILVPGGVIVLLIPAFQALYGPIDENLGHHRRYSRDSIEKLAEASGLRLKKVRYVNVIGFFGWWANSHIFRRGAQSEGQIEVFDRYFVPFVSRLESLVRIPIGQSLFVVLQKP